MIPKLKELSGHDVYFCILAACLDMCKMYTFDVAFQPTYLKAVYTLAMIYLTHEAFLNACSPFFLWSTNVKDDSFVQDDFSCHFHVCLDFSPVDLTDMQVWITVNHCPLSFPYSETSLIWTTSYTIKCRDEHISRLRKGFYPAMLFE